MITDSRTVPADIYRRRSHFYAAALFAQQKSVAVPKDPTPHSRPLSMTA